MSTTTPERAEGPRSDPPRPARRGTWKLYLLLAVCIAPVAASYLMYYVFPPSGRTNYGELIEPQRPVPAIETRPVHPSEARAPGRDGEGMAAFRGHWILVAIHSGECDEACAEKLYFMRQTHASLGKDRDRVARVLLVTDGKPLPGKVQGAHPDLTVLAARGPGRDLLEARWIR